MKADNPSEQAMTPEQETLLNKACIGHLATACDARIVELRACDGCNGSGYMSVYAEYDPELDDVPICPHCADNRAEADRLEALAKSWCWHEYESYQIEGNKLYSMCSCGENTWVRLPEVDFMWLAKKGTISYYAKGMYVDAIERFNPDFTTWEGHGKLIEMIQQVPGLWEAFLDYLNKRHADGVIDALKTVSDPVLFLQAFNAFMEER